MAGKLNGANIAADLKKVQFTALALDNIAKIESVPIDYIVPALDNPYGAEDTEESLYKLAGDIEVNGLINPLVVNKKSETEYRIISGERRYKSITSFLEWKTIECKVFKNMSDDRAQLMLHSANLQTREYSNAQKLGFYRLFDALIEHMKETGEFRGGKQKKLAEMLGVTTRQVQRYQALAALPEEEQQAVISGEVSMSAALKEIQHKNDKKKNLVEVSYNPPTPTLPEPSKPESPIPPIQNSAVEPISKTNPNNTPQPKEPPQNSSMQLPQETTPTREEIGHVSDFDTEFWDEKLKCAIKSHYNTAELFKYYAFSVPTTQEAIKDILKPSYSYSGGSVLFSDDVYGNISLTANKVEVAYDHKKQVFSYSQIDSCVRQLIRDHALVCKDKRETILLEAAEEL